MTTSQQQPDLARWLTACLILLGLLVPLAVFGNDSSANEPHLVVAFGCEGTTEATVISNIDCDMGVADAYDIDRTNGLAPWCDDQVNLSMYGCVSEHGPDQRAGCHQHPPTLHPDGVQRAAQQPCDGDEWVIEILIQLAANETRTKRCLALANPGPACTP